MRPRVFLKGLVLALALSSLPAMALEAYAQPVYDHLKCFTIKDGIGRTQFSVDVSAFDPVNFPPGTCEVRTPAKYMCVPTDKSNAVNIKTGLPPPGAPPGDNPGARLCYNLSCNDRSFRQGLAMFDQFGSRNVEVRRAKYLCTPATREGAPTPTPGATPTPTAEPTATPTPTPEPTAEPTPTPTPGSPAGAFLEGARNF